MNTIPIILKCSVIKDYSQLDVDILFVKNKYGFELTVPNCSKDPYMAVYLWHSNLSVILRMLPLTWGAIYLQYAVSKDVFSGMTEPGVK